MPLERIFVTHVIVTHITSVLAFGRQVIGEYFHMITRILSTVFVALLTVVTLSSCGNTIRGMGRDTANAVDATQDAGRNVDRAARR